MILRPYGPRLTPRLKDRLRSFELDLDKKLRPGYPARLLRPWLDALAEEFFPGQPHEQAHEAIGRAFIIGWKQTLLGRGIVQLVKLLPAKRAIGRIEKNFRATDNFTVIDVTDRGPREMGLRFHDVCDSVHFFHGVLDEGAKVSSAKNPRCRLEKFEQPGAQFVCTWDS